MCILTVEIVVTLLLLTTPDSLCLRDVYVVVPEAAERGSKVEMKCLYNLENQVLYSVKWYRGDREFCRYSPRDVPPLKIFRIPGIEVDPEASDAHRLTIIPETQTANGRYTCEVSADAPSFHTAQIHTHMYVVVLPKDIPSVYGMRKYYRPGNTVKVECASYNSLPAANLSFFINSERALSQHVTHRVDAGSEKGLMSAFSTIQFVVQKHHFIDGKIKIRCTAIIYSIYLKSRERCAEQERIRATPSTLMDVRDPIIHSKHRLPKSNNNGIQIASPTQLLVLVTLVLPTALR